jgi:hypothetical protein
VGSQPPKRSSPQGPGPSSGIALGDPQGPISRPITLVIDMRTYHSLPDNAKPTYVDELAAVMEPATPLMTWQGIRIKPGEIPQVFGRDFIIERTSPKTSSSDEICCATRSPPTGTGFAHAELVNSLSSSFLCAPASPSHDRGHKLAVDIESYGISYTTILSAMPRSAASF